MSSFGASWFFALSGWQRARCFALPTIISCLGFAAWVQESNLVILREKVAVGSKGQDVFLILSNKIVFISTVDRGVLCAVVVRSSS